MKEPTEVQKVEAWLGKKYVELSSLIHNIKLAESWLREPKPVSAFDAVKKSIKPNKVKYVRKT